MKKAIILTENEDNVYGTDIGKHFIDYADKHNLSIQGEMHYPPMMPLLDYKELVSIISNLKDIDVVLVNNEGLIAGEFFHDGKLTEKFHEEGIEIYHTEFDMEVSEICNSFNDKDKKMIKKQIDDVVNELIQKSGSIAIITNDENNPELDYFKEGLLQRSTVNINVISIPEFSDGISTILEKIIKDNNVGEVIVFDKDLASHQMIEFLDNLKIENIEVSYREDIQSDIEQSVKCQGMLFN